MPVFETHAAATTLFRHSCTSLKRRRLMAVRLADYLESGVYVRNTSAYDRAAFAQTLASTAAALPPDDLDLLDRYLVQGIPTRVLAAERSVSSRTVSRRIRALLQRLCSPAYLFYLRSSETLPRRDRNIAYELFCRGASLRECAAKLDITVHRARTTRQRILTIAERRKGVAA
jgi:FixJ family two-component response regulator